MLYIKLGRKKNRKNYYEWYDKDILECVFCKRQIGLWNIKQHLVRCKSCIKLQQLIIPETRDDMYVKFIGNINTLKEDIKENLRKDLKI